MTARLAMFASALFCAFFCALIALVSAPARAEDFRVPALTGPVVDEAGVLGAKTQRAIDAGLRALQEKGGSQINVLTLRSLGGLPIEQASIKIVDEWKLGGRQNDNGVLLLIAPNDRKLRIEVGQGLEGSLTDADSKRIIDQAIIPLIRAGDFNSAITVGVFQIARKTDPDFDMTPYLEGKALRRSQGEGESLRLWMIIALLFFFLIFAKPRRGLGLRHGTRGGHWGGGGWGGGSGGWGGGGGRGWGGGGGGFSGGGASGDW